MVSFPGNEVQSYVHGFSFDPAHGFNANSLLKIKPPEEPDGFVEFWKKQRAGFSSHRPKPSMAPSRFELPNRKVFDVEFTSHDKCTLRGWLTLPKKGHVERGFVIGHGYGGRYEPDDWVPASNAAAFFPCARGLTLSRQPDLPDDPFKHILVGIESPETYILGKCATDVWTAASVLTELVPEAGQRLDYMGISFAGGVGMLALPWESRFKRAHLCVPSFGHYPLRFGLACVGSGKSITEYIDTHPEAADVLTYFDAAIAARHVSISTHIAAALFDPAVPPAGQFAIYNGISAKKELFILHAGHFEYPESGRDTITLKTALERFFKA